MALTQAERDEIVRLAVEGTKTDFANEIASRTVLTTDEVMALGKTKEEREALAAVIAEVTKAAGTNAKKAQSIRTIAGGVEALVSIVRRVI